MSLQNIKELSEALQYSFEERDNRELSVGISNSIALSDYAISNIGLTKDELIESGFKIIQSWIE